MILLIKQELGFLWDSKIGQGKRKLKSIPKDNPEIAKEIENKILESMGVNDSIIASSSEDMDDMADFRW